MLRTESASALIVALALVTFHYANPAQVAISLIGHTATDSKNDGEHAVQRIFVLP